MPISTQTTDLNVSRSVERRWEAGRLGGVWGWVWAALVVGSLVVAFFSWRDLWRRGKALFGEANACTEKLSAPWARLEQATAAAKTNTPTGPNIFEDLATHRERVATLGDKKRERRVARWERRMEAAQEWSLTAWLADRQAAQREPSA